MLATLIFCAIWLNSIALAVKIGRPKGLQTMAVIWSVLLGPLGVLIVWMTAHDQGIPVQQVDRP